MISEGLGAVIAAGIAVTSAAVGAVASKFMHRSEASREGMWQEATSFRRDLLERIEHLESRVSFLESENAKLHAELMTALTKASEYERELIALRARLQTINEATSEAPRR